MTSVLTLTPPPIVDCLPSKDISLTLFVTTGLKDAPDPPPPTISASNFLMLFLFEILITLLIKNY